MLYLPSLGFELDDIMICIYALNDKDMDCVSESLQAIYEISSFLGVKIRYSTFSSLVNYVRSWAMLTDFEKEQLAELIRLLIEEYRRYEYEEVKKIAQKIFKIAIGAQIEFKSAKDAIELALNVTYALLVSTVAVESSEKDSGLVMELIKPQEANIIA